MKKIVAMMLCACMMLGLVGCGGGDTAASNRVVIYTSDDEESNAYFVKRLNEQFPNYDIVMQYLPTGNNASKLKSRHADGSGHCHGAGKRLSGIFEGYVGGSVRIRYVALYAGAGR